MSINKIINLGWDGEQYEVKITMGVIDKIDDEVNLVKLVADYENGDVRLTKVARLFAALLNEGGATEKLLDADGEPVLGKNKEPVFIPLEVDTVFHALFGTGQIKKEDIKLSMAAIFSAIFPSPKKKRTTHSPKVKKTTKKKPTRKKKKA